MEVNYFGTMNSINSVYEYFSERKNGQISIISSVAGYRDCLLQELTAHLNQH